MKRWLLLGILASTALLQTGCGDGVALSRRERELNYKKGLEMDMRMLNDDVDLFLLNERPSRLSRFRVQ